MKKISLDYSIENNFNKIFDIKHPKVGHLFRFSKKINEFDLKSKGKKFLIINFINQYYL